MLWRLVWRRLRKQITKKKNTVRGLLECRHPVISCSLLMSDRDWRSLRHSGQQQTCRTITFPRFRNKKESFTVGQWFIFFFSPGFMWLTNHDSLFEQLIICHLECLSVWKFSLEAGQDTKVTFYRHRRKMKVSLKLEETDLCPSVQSCISLALLLARFFYPF